MKAYKGFDADWKCRDYQFAVGETYRTAEPIKLCSAGFHACEYPLDVFDYYPPTGRIAEVELLDASGETAGDSKRVGGGITIKAALTIAGLVSAAIEYTTTRCSPATAKHAKGDSSAASATGDRSAASATGYRSAVSATGYRSAASATGYSSAASATGDSSAASATGDSSAASATGDDAVAAALGYASTAVADQLGIIVIAWYDETAQRKRLAVGYVGEDGIEPNVAYRCADDGRLVPA